MAKLTPPLSLYGQVLQVLEKSQAAYVIVGGFAAQVYGSTRVTKDVDMIVQLEESHIQALVRAFPLPRYYADPHQMRDSIAKGILFNIIDTETGHKVDLIPLSMDPRNRSIFARRIRLAFEDLSGRLVEAWFARADDVIIGKLRAWDQDRSLRHEQDIVAMLAFLAVDATMAQYYDEAYADRHIRLISPSAWALWQKLKRAAREHQQRKSR